MAFDLKKDWPIAAAGAAAVVGVVALTRQGGQRPVVLGGGVPEGYSEAVQAQASIAQAQLQAQTAAFQTLTTEFGQTERAKAEVNAQVRAIELQTATERHKTDIGLLGTIVGGIFGLFSWETTVRGMNRRAASRQRMETAYGQGGTYERSYGERRQDVVDYHRMPRTFYRPDIWGRIPRPLMPRPPFIPIRMPVVLAQFERPRYAVR